MGITFTDSVGYIAAVIGTFLMLPQVVKFYRTKKVGDASMASVILYVANCSLWLTYGFLSSAKPVVVANAVALVISIAQLILKLKY